MARMHQFFAVAALSLVGVGTGCVSSEKYNASRMQSDAANQQLSEAESQTKSAIATAQLTKDQAQQFKQMAEAKDAINANLMQENNELKLQLAEANRRHQEALANLGKVGGSDLPVALLSELSSFAQQHSDIVEFDEKKGLVKFKSDVTFSPGSDVVKPEAQGTIQRLASILNGPVASQYELLVVGHTDNKPVSSEGTKRAGHKDNWFLSAHRAISVSKMLQQQGTSARRIEVAGCADQRPVAPNDSDANMSRNRRVELFVLPTMVSGSAPASPVAQTPPQPAVQAKSIQKSGTARKLDKDTPAVEAPKVPAFNK